MPELLRLEGLSRRFGELLALNEVGFAVDQGEVVALLGENGAGKSTLVEIVVGGLRPHAGELFLAGESYRPNDPRRARGCGVAVVHQHFQLVEAFTVAENLTLALGAAASRGLVRHWTRLSEELDLPLPLLGQPVRELGVGERQWVEIAKALLVRPRLLLLDEPTALLTPQEADRLFAAVARLAEQGTAVVFITHRLDEVQRVAARVVVLRAGRVVAELRASSPAPVLAEAMVGALPPPPQLDSMPSGEVVARLCRVALPPRLAPLDLELHESEIVVLAGVDGNGQVAAAERLAGIERGPGEVEIAGRRLVNPAPHQLRAMGLSVVPADRTRRGVFPGLTVAENAILGRHRSLASGAGWLAPSIITEAGAELIRELSVQGRPGQLMGELSGGNQQKIVLARALAGAPRLVVAIHPTRGLDVAAQRVVHEMLGRAAAAGAAVLVVSADLEEARRLGDRVLVFSRGRVVGEARRGAPAEDIARWMGGDAA